MSFTHTIKTVSQQLWSSIGLRQSFVTIAATLTASGLSAITLILLSRVVGPEKFGEFSVGFSVLLILVRLCDLGLPTVIAKFAGGTQDLTTIQQVFNLTFKIKLVGFTLVTGGYLLMIPFLTTWLHLASPQILYLVALTFWATAFYEQLQAMLQSIHQFSRGALVTVIQAVWKLFWVLGCIFLGFKSVHTLFVGYMLGSAIPPIGRKLWLAKLVPKPFSMNAVTPDFSSISRHLPALIFHASIGVMAAGLIENLDVLFVQRYLSTFDAGLLGGVGRIALLLQILAFALATVLNPRAARYKADIDKLIFLKKSIIFFGVAFLGWLISLPFTKMAITLTIGDSYLAGLFPLTLLLAAGFMTIATIPLIALIYSFKGGNWFFSVSGLIQFAITLLGNWLLVPQMGITGAALTRVASRVSLLATVMVAIWILWQKNRTLRQSNDLD